MMRKLSPWKVSASHEELFVARYERLLGWSLHLTGNNRDLAEDLLHDAFIQFTLGRRDPSTIQNLDNYLYGILRHLRLSQLRRATRSRLQQLTIVEYDSAHAGLRTIDPSEQIQAQDQLRRICHYVCARKETSKGSSILMLRFFHGYYPGEIAQIARRSREVVEVRLGIARSEAKLSIENPNALGFMGEKPFVEVFPTGFARTPDDFLIELQRMIFNSRRSPCLSRRQLHNLYRGEGATSINTSTIGHIVSCARCLDEVNALLGLPPLSERYPMNTLGKDPGKSGGRGAGGGGATGGGPGVGELLSKFRHRARDTFEHRPKELHISVNGFIQGSQKINSKMSELTLDIDMAETISFVEVFSEQEVRLLLLDVDDPLPPAGPVEQRLEAELSAGRTLALSLKFGSPWPTLKAVYHDPLVAAEGALQSRLLADDSEDVTVSKMQSEGEEEVGRGHSNATEGQTKEQVRVFPRPRLSMSLRNLISRWWFANRTFWLRPETVTALFALTLIASLTLLYRRVPTPAISAADLLQRSTVAEETAASQKDTVVHRTINLEEKSAKGELLARRRVEVWHSAEKGITARRLYDDRGRLIAGDWIRKDGETGRLRDGETDDSRTIYRSHKLGDKLATEESQSTIDNRQLAIGNVQVWQLSPSPKDFSSLIGRIEETRLEEKPNDYVISYEQQSSGAGAKGLVKATLTLSRDDLHATELTLLIVKEDEDSNRQSAIGNRKWREYSFMEASYERHTPSTVAPSVFVPDPELLREVATGKRDDGETIPPSPALPVAPSRPMATAELEVEALRLLNQASADLGEQVSVVRTLAGELKIQGIIETEKRKKEILQALTPIINDPAVRIEIRTVAEALAEQRQPSAAVSSGPQEKVEISGNTIAAQSELRRYVSEVEAGAFAARMVNLSQRAMNHAWALKRLLAQFSEADMRGFAPETRSKWLALIRVHARAFEQVSETLLRELKPIFHSDLPQGGPQEINEITGDADLARAVDRLLDLASANDRVIRSAFAASTESAATTSIKTPQFWRSLKSAEQLAATVQRYSDK